MKTVSTKQLRENMHSVIKDLQAGQATKITYRRHVVGTLQPQPEDLPLHRGSHKSISQFLNHVKFGDVPKNLQTTRISFKDQIVQLRDSELTKK